VSSGILSQINTVHVGPLTFHLYGIIIGTSASIVLLYFISLVPKKITADKCFLYMIFAIFILCIAGGRLAYVLANFGQFQNSFVDIFCIWKGGISIFGVLAGGIVSYSLFWALRLRKKISGLSFFTLTDAAAVSIPLGQAIGRWANFINQELFGPPTDLPWGIYIDREHRPPKYENNENFHPAFLYESVLSLINFIVLRQVLKYISKSRKNNKEGNHEGILTSLYLVNYGIIRIVVERFRVDTNPVILGCKFADIASILMILAGIGIPACKYIISNRRQVAKEKKNQALTKTASILTNVFSPITASLLTIVILYIKFIPHSLRDTGVWFSMTIGSFALAIGILYAFLKTGRISNWDITDRTQRPKVFSFFLALIVLILFVTSQLGYTQAANYLLLSTIGFGIAFAITLMWKISIHTFSVTLSVCLIMDIYKKPWIVIFFIIPLIIAWTRIHLKRHTFSQVAGGIAIALTVYFFWLIANFDVTSTL